MTTEQPDEQSTPEASLTSGVGATSRSGSGRKQLLLRLDPAVHAALAKWAADDLRSVNAQIEVLLRNELKRAGRLPDAVKPLPRRGRPPRGERAD